MNNENGPGDKSARRILKIELQGRTISDSPEEDLLLQRRQVNVVVDEPERIAESVEIISERVNYLTEYVVSEIAELTGFAIENYDCPTIEVVVPPFGADGEMSPFSGRIWVEYEPPASGVRFTRNVIHELVHYFSTRWMGIDVKAPHKPAEVYAIGIGAAYKFDEDWGFGFNAFNEAATTQFEEELTRSIFPDKYVWDYSYLLERGALARLYQAISRKSSTSKPILFSDRGEEVKPEVPLQKMEIEQLFYNYMFASRSKDLPEDVQKAMTNRRRSWGRLMVATFDKDLRKVAELSKSWVETEESKEEYENRIGELLDFLKNY